MVEYRPLRYLVVGNDVTALQEFKDGDTIDPALLPAVANPGAQIDDVAIALDTAWSSNKIDAELATKLEQAALDAHTGQATLHVPLNDGSSGPAVLWSAQKIVAEAAAAQAAAEATADAALTVHTLDAGIHNGINDAGSGTGTIWSANKIAAEDDAHQAAAEATAAGALSTHTSDATIHRSIDDGAFGTTDLWSADQIGSEDDNHQAAAEATAASALGVHTGDATIHRSINDAGSAATDTWSAQKIASEDAIAQAAAEATAAGGLAGHTGNDTIHRVIDDGSVVSTVLWSASKIAAEDNAHQAAAEATSAAALALKANLAGGAVFLDDIEFADPMLLRESGVTITADACTINIGGTPVVGLFLGANVSGPALTISLIGEGAKKSGYILITGASAGQGNKNLIWADSALNWAGNPLPRVNEGAVEIVFWYGRGVGLANVYLGYYPGKSAGIIAGHVEITGGATKSTTLLLTADEEEVVTGKKTFDGEVVFGSKSSYALATATLGTTFEADFDGPSLEQHNIGGSTAIAVTGVNYATGIRKSIRFINGANDANTTWPAAWQWLALSPPFLVANTEYILELFCMGGSESTVRAWITFDSNSIENLGDVDFPSGATGGDYLRHTGAKWAAEGASMVAGDLVNLLAIVNLSDVKSALSPTDLYPLVWDDGNSQFESQKLSAPNALDRKIGNWENTAAQTLSTTWTSVVWAANEVRDTDIFDSATAADVTEAGLYRVEFSMVVVNSGTVGGINVPRVRLQVEGVTDARFSKGFILDNFAGAEWHATGHGYITLAANDTVDLQHHKDFATTITTSTVIGSCRLSLEFIRP